MDAVASESQFLDHIAPVWTSLPDRGTFYVERSLLERAQGKGIAAQPIDAQAIRESMGQQPPRFDGPPCLVASIGDLKVARRMGYGPFAFLEHGAGQTYGDLADPAHSSYSGGPDHDDCELFLAPSEAVAGRWRERYPRSRSVVAGCPKLDALPRLAGSIGLQCDPWNDLLAAIRTPPRTPEFSHETSGLCVAHAITDVNVSALGSSERRGTGLRPNTTDSGISPADLTLPVDQPSRAQTAMAALKSATSTCTNDSASSCPGHATSAAPSTDLRWLSDGTLLRSIGRSATTGSHILSIPTTTFGSVSLAIPCTTGRGTSQGTSSTQGGGSARATVCISFHWPAPMSVGWGYAGTCAPEYMSILPQLRDRFELIGHQHPNWLQRKYSGPPSREYAKLGIPFVEDFEDVCRQAAVYVCDNSSTIFEFAATGRPVVLLNSRHWSRKVEYGLRFWEAAHVGLNVNDPAQLVAAVEVALIDHPEQQAAREDALSLVYQPRSGGAALAAAAITEWLASRERVAVSA